MRFWRDNRIDRIKSQKIRLSGYQGMGIRGAGDQAKTKDLNIEYPISNSEYRMLIREGKRGRKRDRDLILAVDDTGISEKERVT